MNGWVGSFGITLVHWDHKESDAGKEINRDTGGVDAGDAVSGAIYSTGQQADGCSAKNYYKIYAQSCSIFCFIGT